MVLTPCSTVISFTIQTSWMGSPKMLRGACLACHLLHHRRKVDGVGARRPTREPWDRVPVLRNAAEGVPYSLHSGVRKIDDEDGQVRAGKLGAGGHLRGGSPSPRPWADEKLQTLQTKVLRTPHYPISAKSPTQPRVTETSGEISAQQTRGDPLSPLSPLFGFFISPVQGFPGATAIEPRCERCPALRRRARE